MDPDAPAATIPLIVDAAGRPGQIGIVVRDLREGLRIWGVQPHVRPAWRVWEYNQNMMSESTYRGEPGTFSMLLAMGGSDPQVELIEPLTGPNIYDDWLEVHGPGLHHLGMYVDDLRATDARMLAAGFDNVQSGNGMGADGSGGFVYYDTVSVLGYYLEAIEVPRQRREPAFIWPDPADDQT